MEIRLLVDGYRDSESLYRDFVNDNISYAADYFSDKSVFIDQAPEFPIYMAKGTSEKKKNDFILAVHILKDSYIETDRDIHMNEVFWHSILIGQMRDYLIRNYPEVKDNQDAFNNIIFKRFDWENYIYKCVLAAEYISDAHFSTQEIEDRYIELIYSNLDLYNYIIKYSVFRNSTFIIKFLTVVDQNDLSGIMKAKIKDRPDLKADERYGRRVIIELNKNYPVIMSPSLDLDDLQKEILNALSLYRAN